MEDRRWEVFGRIFANRIGITPLHNALLYSLLHG
jgi:hypothetical protein